MGEGWCWKTEGFVEQKLLGGVGNVVFTTNHMGDRHGGVVHHNHEVVQGVTDLIRRGASGDHHVATKIATTPTHRSAD